MSQFTSIHAVLVALILITAWGGVSSQSVMFGKCQRPYPPKDFNIRMLEGEWFPRYQFSRKFSPCTKFVLNQTSETSLDLTTLTRTTFTTDLKVEASLVLSDSSYPGYMKLVWNVFPQIGDEVTAIDVYPETHALLFFCTDFGLFHYQTGVIFTRNETSLPREIVIQARRKMNDIGGNFPMPFEEDCPLVYHPGSVEKNDTDIQSFSFGDIFKHTKMALQLVIHDV